MVKVVEIAVLIMFCMLLGGCPPKSDNNLPDGLKIKDLGATNNNDSSNSNLLKVVNLSFHVLEIPAENFNKLVDVRRSLDIKPLKFNNYLAFSANSFSAYYGKYQKLFTVYELLQMAEAQTVIESKIWLADGESDNLIIKQLPQNQVVNYSNMKSEPEAARVGPGYITLHIDVEKAVSLDDSAKVTIFPLFSLMTTASLRDKLPDEYKDLDNHQNFGFASQDFAFTSAAMQLNMTPGDFIFLAPEKHISDQTDLSGIFFSNPSGSLFYQYDERKLPERKPSVRVYLLTCLGLNL